MGSKVELASGLVVAQPAHYYGYGARLTPLGRYSTLPDGSHWLPPQRTEICTPRKTPHFGRHLYKEQEGTRVRAVTDVVRATVQQLQYNAR